MSEKTDGTKVLKDKFAGREIMKNVKEKKYLGDLISSDGSNSKNIKERTDKSNGIINNIVSALHERPYGRHEFKAYKIMREGLLLGGMLTNTDSWINISKKDIEKLEKPDTILMRKILSASGNPSKSFMMPELGIVPVRYVIMKKRLQFLHHILTESTETLIRQVFDVLNEDSRKGDFVYLTNHDKIELEIDLSNEEISSISKWSWKKYLREKVTKAAFKFLIEDNDRKEKTRDIKFYQLQMNEYLFQNENTNISQVIFSIRSKTLDLKTWRPWQYKNDLCVKCGKSPETMDHFVSCVAYGKEIEYSWTYILEDDTEKQKYIAKFISVRHNERKKIIEKQEGGQASNSGSYASEGTL